VVRKASGQLGLRENQIYDCRRKKRESGNIAPKGVKAGETIEEGFKRLERENAELSEANTILKRAMFFLVGR